MHSAPSPLLHECMGQQLLPKTLGTKPATGCQASSQGDSDEGLAQVEQRSKPSRLRVKWLAAPLELLSFCSDVQDSMSCFARTTPRQMQSRLQRRFRRGRFATWKASSLCQSGCHWLTLLGRRLASTTCSPTAPRLAWRLGPRRRWTSPWGASRKSSLSIQIKRDFFSLRASGCSPKRSPESKEKWMASYHTRRTSWMSGSAIDVDTKMPHLSCSRWFRAAHAAWCVGDSSAFVCVSRRLLRRRTCCGR